MCHILPPQTGISERVELQPHRNSALWYQTALFHDYFDGDCQDNGDDTVRIQKMHELGKTFRKQNPWIIALAIWIRVKYFTCVSKLRLDSLTQFYHRSSGARVCADQMHGGSHSCNLPHQRHSRLGKVVISREKFNRSEKELLQKKEVPDVFS